MSVTLSDTLQLPRIPVRLEGGHFLSPRPYRGKGCEPTGLALRLERVFDTLLTGSYRSLGAWSNVPDREPIGERTIRPESSSTPPVPPFSTQPRLEFC